MKNYYCKTLKETIQDEKYLWRAVSKDINDTLENLLGIENKPKKYDYNLGLFARKWSVHVNVDCNNKDYLKCPSSSDMVKSWGFDRKKWNKHPLKPLMDNLKLIQGAFDNNSNDVTKSELSTLNKNREKISKSYLSMKYHVLSLELTMKTPLIHGLGETHPMEKFMTFDRNTGIPYIPSSSVKGVVRARVMVNEINQFSSVKELEQNNLVIWKKIDVKSDKKELVINEQYKPFRELFGAGEESKENPATKGKVIFLDAFPIRFPKLKREIMTPHHPKYYGSQGKDSGPTEVQDPIPNAYLSVDPEEGKQKWSFIMLIHPSVDKKNIEKLKTAFTDESASVFGFGSKTALGYGQFDEDMDQWELEKAEKKLMMKNEKQN